MMEDTNPYKPKSGFWHNFEHRFERLQLPNGKLHAWHCWCGTCDMIKNHCHSEYKIIVVDEPSDVENLYPYSAPTIDFGEEE